MEIIINKKKVKAKKGETIFLCAKKNKINIPSLCFHPDLKIKGNCRLCLVEVKGREGLFTSCNLIAEDGMNIITDSLKIRRAVKINLELLFAQHCEECYDCVFKDNCTMLEMAKKYDVSINRFKDRKKDYPVYEFGPSLIFDSSKCIDCRNCVEFCKENMVNFLKIKERGHLFKVIPSKKEKCIYCGQCIIHCPAGAFEGAGEFEEIEKPLLDKKKFVIFQFAPSIRTSIGEGFGINRGVDLTEKLVSALKKVGAYKVFDVCVGADFTTIEEAKELIERIKEKKPMPMFTSCCPAWVKFVKSYYPEIIPNLTTVRSPHIISGGLIKTYFAKENKINPEDITVVSIMPCVSKKYEIEWESLKINGIKPVDTVMTTREVIRLFKKRGIDLKKISSSKIDSPFGNPSGAGIIYGASGGVMESALRTAYKQYTNKELKNIDFKNIRGLTGIKTAKIKIGERELRVAVVYGINNAKEIIKNKDNFDYVEVMVCPGGCIGGGGQPLPTDSEIRKKRAKGLYNIDKNKKKRMAHQNEEVEKIYKDFLNSSKKIKEICHTKFEKES